MGNQIAVQPKGAPGSQPQAPNPIVSFVPMLFVIAVIYFLLIRPQQRAAKELKGQVDALKPGDKVLASGIYGTVISLRGDVVSLRLAEGKMDVSRSAIGRVLNDTNSTTPSAERVS